MDLESGDVGIEDTLYSYFTNEYQYIQKLSVYLMEWVRTIRIRDCLPRTSKIKDNSDDLFLTFRLSALVSIPQDIDYPTIATKSRSKMAPLKDLRLKR